MQRRSAAKTRTWYGIAFSCRTSLFDMLFGRFLCRRDDHVRRARSRREEATGRTVPLLPRSASPALLLARQLSNLPQRPVTADNDRRRPLNPSNSVGLQSPTLSELHTSLSHVRPPHCLLSRNSPSLTCVCVWVCLQEGMIRSLLAKPFKMPKPNYTGRPQSSGWPGGISLPGFQPPPTCRVVWE